MLVYRLIHFKDAIPDIDIGLDGRDKELCKPLLQLFDNTESYSEIRATLQKFLDAKNQKKSNLIEAALLPLIVNILSLLGKKEISAKYIWDEIVGITPNGIKEGKIIEGYYDSKKPNEYQTADYGTIYRNTITNIICDKFGAERKRNENGSILTFDFEKLSRVANIYNIEANMQKKLIELDHEGIVGNVGSTEAESSSVEDGHAKIVNNQSNNDKKSVDTIENHVDNTTQKDTKEPIVSEEPTEPTSTVSELSKNDIEEFFNDNPGTPWKWIEHTIEVSPCRSIIHQDEDGWYYCKLHSVIKHEHATRAVRLRSLNLSEIEQHCKYHKPEVHKAEILKQLGLEAQGKSWETR
ncbi:MAG: hypothetical protein ACJ704_11490 [Nitrososphaeraceae archaeon]